jgi:hypothetical protein
MSTYFYDGIFDHLRISLPLLTFIVMITLFSLCVPHGFANLNATSLSSLVEVNSRKTIVSFKAFFKITSSRMFGIPR